MPITAQIRCTDKELRCKQAQEIALKRVPGQVLHVDIYEFFILTAQNRLFEVEVLAKTGRILKVEEEDDLD